MMKRNARKLIERLALALGGAAALTACAGEVGSPEALQLTVRTPIGAENPFELPQAAFVAVSAEGLGMDPTRAPVIVQPYSPGMRLSLPDIPFGSQRQVRVEVWSAGATGQPEAPIGRGRSMPVDITAAGAVLPMQPYVTRINRFAPAIADDGNQAATDPRLGVGTVLLGNGQVLMFGGASLKPDAKDPYDPQSHAGYSDQLFVYDTASRMAGATGIQLGAGRAFAGVATGTTAVAIAGGWEMTADGPKASKRVEYFDMATSTVTTAVSQFPDLAIGRANPTVVHLFANSNYFLILGGQGDTPCFVGGKEQPCAGNTWELWSPETGNVLKDKVGQLASARWNHAAVRLPGNNGGFVVLIGGENENGVRADFEVVKFGFDGAVAKVAGIHDENPEWRPFLHSLAPQDVAPVGRTLPGAVYVSHPAYNFIYIVGGFADKERTKPLGRVDVYDIQRGRFVAADGTILNPGEASTLSLNTARGAPMLAAVTHGERAGQVLVAGGSVGPNTHLDSAEFLYYPNPGQGGSITPVPVENPMLGGSRTLGKAVALQTGHVLVVGGAGHSGTSLQTQGEAMLWNPF